MRVWWALNRVHHPDNNRCHARIETSWWGLHITYSDQPEPHNDWATDLVRESMCMPLLCISGWNLVLCYITWGWPKIWTCTICTIFVHVQFVQFMYMYNLYIFGLWYIGLMQWSLHCNGFSFYFPLVLAKPLLTASSLTIAHAIAHARSLRCLKHCAWKSGVYYSVAEMVVQLKICRPLHSNFAH